MLRRTMVVVALLLGVSEIGCAWVTRTWPHWPKDTGTHQALVEFATGPTENSMSHIGYNWSSDSEKNLLTLSSVWLRFRFHTHGYDNEAISINVPGEPKDFFIDEAHVDEKNITSYYGYATIRVPHGEQPRYLYVRIENPISYPFEYIYGPYDQHRLAIAVKTAQFRGVHLSRYQWAIVKTPYNWRNAFVWRTLTSFYPSITNEQTEIAFELVDDRIEDDSALVVELWPNYKGIRITFDKRVVYEETAKGTYRGSEVAIVRSETNHLLIRTIPEMTARRIEMIVAFKDSSALEKCDSFRAHSAKYEVCRSRCCRRGVYLLAQNRICEFSVPDCTFHPFGHRGARSPFSWKRGKAIHAALLRLRHRYFDLARDVRLDRFRVPFTDHPYIQKKLGILNRNHLLFYDCTNAVGIPSNGYTEDAAQNVHNSRPVDGRDVIGFARSRFHNYATHRNTSARFL